MKQKTHLNFTALIVGLIFLAAYMWDMKNPAIIKQTTDNRGLTSIVFKQDGKIWALDYLTKNQLDSLMYQLNDQ